MATISISYMPSDLRKEAKAPTLASGITLSPVRMGEFMAQSIKTEESTIRSKNIYVPPNKRNTSDTAISPKLESIEFTESNFPTLGAPVKPPISIPGKINFKKVVNDRLEKEKQLEKGSGADKDINKLTRDQLEADGWAILSLGGVSTQKEYNEETININNDDDIFREKPFTEEMEEEVKNFFEAYKNPNSPQYQSKFIKKIKTPSVLIDACMSYRAKAIL